MKIMKRIAAALLLLGFGFLLGMGCFLTDSKSKGAPRLHLASFQDFDSIWTTSPVVIQGEDGYDFIRMSGVLRKTASVVNSETRVEKTVLCILEKVGLNSIRMTIIGDREFTVGPVGSKNYKVKTEMDGGILTCVLTRS